jgi:hypothetical protein
MNIFNYLFTFLKKIIKIISKYIFIPVITRYYIILLLGIGFNIFFFLLVKNILFTDKTSFEDLFVLSLANTTIFAITLYVYSIVTLHLIKSKPFRIKGQVFILGFFFISEFFLVLALFDCLSWLGIHVTIGVCPWIYFRPFLIVLFIIIFCLIIRFSYGLSKDYFPDEIDDNALEMDEEEKKKNKKDNK